MTTRILTYNVDLLMVIQVGSNSDPKIALEMLQRASLKRTMVRCLHEIFITIKFKTFEVDRSEYRTNGDY